MAKTKISEYDSTSANNTDVDSINIAEGCAPSGINNAIREVMAHLKDFQTGASGDSLTVGGNLSVTGTVTIPDNAISGDKVEGGTINAITINTLSANPTLSAGTANGVTYLNGSKVLTSGSALTFDGSTFNVTGTVVSDGLTVDGDVQIADAQTLYFSGTSGDYASINYTDSDPDTFALNFYQNSGFMAGMSYSALSEAAGGGLITFKTGGTNTLKLDNNGDISFYEDTGTTAKFFWDASAESLGIGTSSPTDRLSVGTSSGGTQVKIQSGSGVNNCILHTNGTTDSWRVGMNLSLTNGSYEFYDDINNVTRLTLDSAGNLGLGVTPSGWGATFISEEIGNGLGLMSNGSSHANILQNAYYNGTNWIYRFTNAASRFQIDSGNYKWHTAPSGTAGNAISFTQAMTLTAAGNLGVGTTSPTNGKVEIQTIATTAGLWVQTGGTTSSYTIADFRTGTNSPALIVKGDGNVGIGTSSPSFKLDISGGGSTAKINTLDTYDGGASLSTWMKVGRRSGSGTNAYINTLHSGSDSVSALTWAFGTTGTGNEVMRIDSSGNLLVKKTVNDNTTTGTVLRSGSYISSVTNNEISLLLNRANSDGDIALFRKDGVTVGSVRSLNSTLIVGSASGTSNTALRFNATQIIPVSGTTSSDKDANTDIGSSGARFKDLYLSGGVYVGGTGAANHLDDYEEGTWTPVVQGTTTAGSASYSIQQGSYVKVGKLVYWNARVGYTGHTGSGNMQIAGLPFTAANKYATGSYSFRDNLTVPSGNDVLVTVFPNASIIRIMQIALGTNSVPSLSLDTDVTDFALNGVYEVA